MLQNCWKLILSVLTIILNHFLEKKVMKEYKVINPLVAKLFRQIFDLLSSGCLSCKFLQQAVR